MPGGRPPKPTALKVLTGNPGKRPLNDAEPQPSTTPPKCPSWLSKVAKAEWKKLAPELSRLGLLTIVDEGSLAGYCSALAEFRAATEIIEAEGRYVMVGGFYDEAAKEWRGGQMQPHPALIQLRAAWKAVKDFSALFGLDPSSRTRLSVKGAKKEEGTLKAFIGGKRPGPARG
jgi:P27 family predicted phage terminase small subunit